MYLTVVMLQFWNTEAFFQLCHEVHAIPEYHHPSWGMHTIQSFISCIVKLIKGSGLALMWLLHMVAWKVFSMISQGEGPVLCPSPRHISTYVMVLLNRTNGIRTKSLNDKGIALPGIPDNTSPASPRTVPIPLRFNHWYWLWHETLITPMLCVHMTSWNLVYHSVMPFVLIRFTYCCLSVIYNDH